MLNARLTSLSRRRVLQGLGVALPLPWLEAMGPVYGWSESTDADRLAPCRMAFVYAPNGKHMPSWTPEKIGTAFDLSETLQPLAGLRHKLLVLSGLTADKARPYGDGGGGHARAMAAFLTGTHPVKTDGTDIRNGVSVDQVAAARIGDRTRLASLEMGAEHAQGEGLSDPDGAWSDAAAAGAQAVVELVGRDDWNVSAVAELLVPIIRQSYRADGRRLWESPAAGVAAGLRAGWSAR